MEIKMAVPPDIVFDMKDMISPPLQNPARNKRLNHGNLISKHLAN